MDNLFDPDSRIMGVLAEIADLIIANILWIITSIQCESVPFRNTCQCGKSIIHICALR